VSENEYAALFLLFLGYNIYLKTWSQTLHVFFWASCFTFVVMFITSWLHLENSFCNTVCRKVNTQRYIPIFLGTGTLLDMSKQEIQGWLAALVSDEEEGTHTTTASAETVMVPTCVSSVCGGWAGLDESDEEQDVRTAETPRPVVIHPPKEESCMAETVTGDDCWDALHESLLVFSLFFLLSCLLAFMFSYFLSVLLSELCARGSARQLPEGSMTGN